MNGTAAVPVWARRSWLDARATSTAAPDVGRPPAVRLRPVEGGRPGVGLPEHCLMYAVLADAIALVTRGPASLSTPSRRAVAEATDWLLSDDRAWPFSVRNVCEELDVDVGDLRRQLAPHLHTPCLVLLGGRRLARADRRPAP